MKISVVSGQKHYRNMTNKHGDRNYAVAKAQIWMSMLNDGMKPTRWLKANAKGTKVNFDAIKTSEEYDKGLSELQEYLNEINEKFSLGISISRE